MSSINTGIGASGGGGVPSTNPAFLVYNATGATNATGDGTIINPFPFDTVITNVSSSYSTVTNLFVAPVSGLYLFGCTILAQNTIGGASQISQAFITTSQNYFLQNTDSGGSGNDQTFISILAPMTAGDSCQVYWAVGGGAKTVGYYGVPSDPRTNFYGYLVQPS